MCSALVGGKVTWPSKVSWPERSARNQEVISSESNEDEANNQGDNCFPHLFPLTVEACVKHVLHFEALNKEAMEPLMIIFDDYTT